jgi:hypothetical protein
MPLAEPEPEPLQQGESLKATSVKRPRRHAMPSRVPLIQRLRLPGRRADYATGAVAAVISIVIGVAIASFLK